MLNSWAQYVDIGITALFFAGGFYWATTYRLKRVEKDIDEIKQTSVANEITLTKIGEMVARIDERTKK